MEKECLIEEYNKRLKHTESERQDEQWFRVTIHKISDGAFTCYGQGRHLYQEKECSWNTIYELLSCIDSVDAKIIFKVAANDFTKVGEEYKENKIIKNAIKEGKIQIDATFMEDKSVRLLTFLDWDVGDSENYSRWTINLMVYLDKNGRFIKPFFVVDTR